MNQRAAFFGALAYEFRMQIHRRAVWITFIARFSDVFLVVSTTLGLLVVSAIALIAIVPLSILFSYLVMRHTTQRVKTLATATSVLRGGNYGIRIPVVGDDEVAQLQADFNAMATDLERSMRELREERDRVVNSCQIPVIMLCYL